MCNLYSQTKPQEAMRQLFNAKDLLGNQPSLPAIFPDDEAPVCLVNDAGSRELVRMRWGWHKAKFGWVTNARKLTDWPWKNVIPDISRRCLVPATSFAEYHPTEMLPPSAPGRKPRKAATWFAVNGDDDRPLFAFAGLWHRWKGERRKGEHWEGPCYTILTTEANSVVAPIHPKAMPVILHPEDYERWLHAPADEAIKLQRPFPADQMRLLFTGEKADEAA